ncbi:hypothetical protein [Streptomyces sp. NBC_01477]|uniref:hypothetical protein n=1 Tax=Streptomyces sp. NBC_01477 TaxID=2976015 RepID=UPI002E341B6C|nr:hypothetical protein [Streptomyces sp. NBC_01477]
MAAAAAGLCLVSGGSSARITAANVSQNLRACLVTGPTGAQEAPLVRGSWDGLRETAKNGKVNAQRFTVPDTKPDVALPFLNGVVQQQCEVIITAGGPMQAATEAAARANPRQRFAIVGSPATRPNITAVAAADGPAAKAAVVKLVTRLAAAE